MRTVHIVCGRLRDKPCKGCPAREKSEHYGWVQRGCYALAQELINIAKHGGPFKSTTANRRWRKRVKRYQKTEVL